MQPLPEAPNVSVVADQERGALVVHISEKHYGGGPRAVVEYRIHRSEKNPAGEWINEIRRAKDLPPDTSQWADHTVASRQPYRYSVEMVLASGRTVRSAWVE